MTRQEYKNMVRNTLRSDAYWSVNKQLTQRLGIRTALFLSELLFKEAGLDEGNKIEDGWFYYLKEEIKERTTLSISKQETIVQKLKRKGLVEIKRKGLPARLFYRINYKGITDELSKENPKSRSKKTQDLDTLKTQDQDLRKLKIYNNNKINNNKTNNNNLSKERLDNNSTKRSKLKDSPINYSSSSKEIKKWSLQDTPANILSLFDFWKSLSCNGSRLHKPTLTSKSTRRSVDILKQVLQGKHDKIPKLTEDQIKDLFQQHALEALDSSYLPHGGFKDRLRSLTLGDFFWNDWSKDGSPLQSRCLHLLVNKPKLCSESVCPMKDENPRLTNRVRKMYERTLGGHKPKYDQQKLNRFVRASRKLSKFHSKIYRKLVVPESVYHLADTLREALLDNFDEIEIGHFCSDYTYDKVLPAYMHKQAMLKE